MVLNKQTVEFLIFLIGVVIKYGAPAVKNFIDTLEKDEISKEDLIALILDKSPNEFFE